MIIKAHIISNPKYSLLIEKVVIVGDREYDSATLSNPTIKASLGILMFNSFKARQIFFAIKSFAQIKTSGKDFNFHISSFKDLGFE